MSTNVTEQIKLIIQEFGLSAGQFADEIKIIRSRISHILTGRNNPSLEIIQAILTRYPEISPSWLLFGNEPMFTGSEPSSKTEIPLPVEVTSRRKEEDLNLFNYKSNVEKTAKSEAKIDEQIKEKTENKVEITKIPPEVDSSKNEKSSIRMITVFYTDKKYENFLPE